MYEDGKSYSPVVPTNPPNKALAAEAVEERGLAKGNTAGKTRSGLRAGTRVSHALDRVRQVAERDKDVKFTALLHHVTVERLRDAYRAIRPNSAPGVDGQTWEAYGQNLEDNLRDLHRRLHSGAYRAKPSRRVYIPKAAARHRQRGGQDRPTRRRRGAKQHLRGGLSRFLLRVPARAQPARCAGRADVRDQAEEGELGARRRRR